jgi:hypothetical protein
MRIILIIILFIAIGCNSPRHIAVVKFGGKFGCIDSKGNWVIKPVWDWIMLGENRNDPILIEKDSLFGYLSNKDQIIISPRFKDASIFYEGLASVGNGSKKGFININGDTIIPFHFDDIFLGFSNGLSDATINDSSGYINKHGSIVIPFIYDLAYPFLSEYAEVRTFSGEVLVLDKNGHVVTDERKYANKRLWTRNSADFRLAVEGPNGRGWLNEKGDTIVKPVYESVGIFTEGRSIVKKGNKWGVVDNLGREVVVPKYDDLWHFSEGLANFQTDGKWGYIDKHGKVVIAPTYEYASEFNFALAYVEINGKAGFIDKTGKFIIKPIFEPARLDGHFR